MQAKVKDVVSVIDAIAPFDSTMGWDNVGLLAGDPEASVSRIVTALDVAPGVIEEAQAQGAALIVTHHPLLFAPVRRLCADEPQGDLIVSLLGAGIALIAAHTNWDLAPGGANDALMQAAGFPGAVGEGTLRTAPVADKAPDALLAQLSERLKTTALFFGNRERPVRRLASCSGAGGDALRAARDTGADCYLTGELKHHELLEAMQLGLRVVLVGHRASEEPAVDALNRALQSRLNALQYSVRVIRSKVNPFS